MSTMALSKTAIAVPQDVLEGIDRLAKQRQQSRSAFITEVLRAVLRNRSDHEMTRQLDAVFGDPEVERQQLAGASALDAAGTDFGDERW